jgi:hypothetical protein
MQEVSEEHFWHHVHFALGSVKFAPGKRFLEDVERDRLASALIESFKKSKWKVMNDPQPLAPSTWKPHSVNDNESS